jgi:hypothetical protein
VELIDAGLVEPRNVLTVAGDERLTDYDGWRRPDDSPDVPQGEPLPEHS